MRTVKPIFFSLLILSTCTANSSLLAQDAQADTIAPVAALTFEKIEYSFDKVTDGDQVTQIYTFTNISHVPLLLFDVKGSCGCTVPQWPHEPIMPGETASLTVQFDSSNKMGLQRKKITVTANTNPPQTFLYLNGEVISKGSNESKDDLQLEVPLVKASPDCLAIYPNPTSDVLHLDIDSPYFGQPAVVSIFAQSGALMAKKEFPALEGGIEFQIAHYPAGTYVANIQVGDAIKETRCFVVVD